MPRLLYTAPTDLYHSALGPPQIYESNRTNASLQIYDFRPAPADVAARFHQTLLRDWVAPQYQEVQLAAPPTFGTWDVPGADSAYFAQFAEASGWMPRPRLRVVIVADASAALVDSQAQSLQAWQLVSQSFEALAATLRVERGEGRRRRPTSAAMRRFAGMYVGAKPKFVSAIGPRISAGSGGFVQARHLYLFSADGRVYRAYDALTAPDGDIRQFDFDEAALLDPVNSGQYALSKDELTIRMGERLDEVIVVRLQQPGLVAIAGVKYARFEG